MGYSGAAGTQGVMQLIGDTREEVGRAIVCLLYVVTIVRPLSSMQNDGLRLIDIRQRSVDEMNSLHR